MKLKRWEIALLASLAAVILFCAVPVSAQTRLAGKLVRLHVVANSDSEGDQALKLLVRDAVLAEAEDAPAVTDALLLRMGEAAVRTLRDNGCLDEATVVRTRMWFDTREYATFSLPAGYYDAVRVTIGEGRGRNWWCVLFPPLCAGTCEADLEQVAAQAGLTDDEIAFLCEDGTAYVIRFKITEIWGKLLHSLNKGGI